MTQRVEIYRLQTTLLLHIAKIILHDPGFHMFLLSAGQHKPLSGRKFPGDQPSQAFRQRNGPYRTFAFGSRNLYRGFGIAGTIGLKPLHGLMDIDKPLCQGNVLPLQRTDLTNTQSGKKTDQDSQIALIHIRIKISAQNFLGRP